MDNTKRLCLLSFGRELCHSFQKCWRFERSHSKAATMICICSVNDCFKTKPNARAKTKQSDLFVDSTDSTQCTAYVSFFYRKELNSKNSKPYHTASRTLCTVINSFTHTHVHTFARSYGYIRNNSRAKPFSMKRTSNVITCGLQYYSASSLVRV